MPSSLTPPDTTERSARRADIGLLVLRLGVGGMMAFGHGWGKLASFSERAGTFSDPLGIGSLNSLLLVVVAEFVCAVLIMLGLFTRAACVPPLITMLVAAFVQHAGQAFGNREKALLFAVAFIVIL